MLPPGRDRHSDYALGNRVGHGPHDDRNRAGRVHGRQDRRRAPGRDDQPHLAAHEILGEDRKEIIRACKTSLDDEILPLDPSEFSHGGVPLRNIRIVAESRWLAPVQETDAAHLLSRVRAGYVLQYRGNAHSEEESSSIHELIKSGAQ
jgi:hypothetical protein